MAEKPLTVARNFRTHPDSHTDGGVTIVVKKRGGKELKYPDVKNPKAFMKAIWRNDAAGKNEVLEVYVEGETKKEENK